MLRKYGVATHIYIPIVKRAVVDFAVSADWTPAAGDVKISKDGGAAANVTNLPTAITMGNGAVWDYSLTATEMQAAKVVVTIVDAATKAVEDQSFLIVTYGNASAELAGVDFTDAVRLGLTALPNAAAEAAGGLYTRGTGAGQIRQDANGRIDANAKAWIDGTIPAVNVTGVPLVDLKYILGTVLTETSGQIAGAFKKLFDVAAPVLTALSVNQTGDNYARLGAPAGASIAADLAEIEGETDTLLAGVTVTTNSDKTGYALTSGERNSIADAMLDRDMSLGADSGSSIVRTLRQAVRFLRNKWTVSAGVLTIYKEDDATTSWTGTVSTDASALPITGEDPSGP